MHIAQIGIYPISSRFYDGCPAKTELTVGIIVAVTAVFKIVMFGSSLAIFGDIVFLVALLVLRSQAALIMLLLASSIAIPSVPGIDKVLGGPFLIEIAIAILAFKVWHSSRYSIKLYLPKLLLIATCGYGILLIISVVRGGKVADHLVTTRYFLLLLMTAYAARGWVIHRTIARDSVEELLFRALRAGLAVYCLLFILQFFTPEVYDQIFRSSGGEREGTRVAYQIQGYIPIVSLSLLFAGTMRVNDPHFPKFYAGLARQKWIILALFGMIATGARMILLQWILVAGIFIFFRSRRAFVGIIFAAIFGILILSLPMFSSLIERFSSISDSDAFIGNLGIRLLPAALAITEMSGFDYVIGKGFDYKFFVPWFETRSDDFDAYSTFIDQLWATIFVQAGIAGSLLALLPFISGLIFYVRNRTSLRYTPTVRFLILFYLMGIHGFANFAYAKNVYVILGFLIGAAVAFKVKPNENTPRVLPEQR